MMLSRLSEGCGRPRRPCPLLLHSEPSRLAVVTAFSLKLAATLGGRGLTAQREGARGGARGREGGRGSGHPEGSEHSEHSESADGAGAGGGEVLFFAKSADMWRGLCNFA